MTVLTCPICSKPYLSNKTVDEMACPTCLTASLIPISDLTLDWKPDNDKEPTPTIKVPSIRVTGSFPLYNSIDRKLVTLEGREIHEMSKKKLRRYIRSLEAMVLLRDQLIQDHLNGIDKEPTNW
jgi:hypothetical protein